MTLTDALIAGLIMLLWGVNFVAIKFGLTELPPLLMLALRFAVVALVLIWFVRPPWEKMGRILALSVTLGGLHFSLMFTGLQYVDASTAAIAIQLQVPFAAVLSLLVFKDFLGWRRLLGMTIAFAGVVLIAGEPRGSQSLYGLGLVVTAALVWAVVNIQIKEIGQVNGFALNAWIALLATPQLLIASFLFEDNQWQALEQASWISWGAILYMAVLVTIVGYGLWYHLMSRYEVNQTMPFTLLVPVFGVLSGVLFLNEPFTWQMAVGGAMTVAGVGIIVLRRPRLVDPQAEASCT